MQACREELAAEISQALQQVESQQEGRQAAQEVSENFQAELLQEVRATEENLQACREQLSLELDKVEARLTAQLKREDGDGEASALLKEEMGTQLAEVEKRLVKRHDSLVVTLNKDLGQLDLRLSRDVENLADQVHTTSEIAATSGEKKEEKGVNNTFSIDLEELKQKMNEEQESQTANLQELGELVLGELAVVRNESDKQIVALREELRTESKARQEECCQLGEGLVGLADQLSLLATDPAHPTSGAPPGAVAGEEGGGGEPGPA